MKQQTILVLAAVAGAVVLLGIYSKRAALASTNNQAAGPRLPALPSLPSLPPLPAVSGAVPNMPKMPRMPSMPWMSGGQIP